MTPEEFTAGRTADGKPIVPPQIEMERRLSEAVTLMQRVVRQLHEMDCMLFKARETISALAMDLSKIKNGGGE